ncbi:MAG: hypothetical protein HYR85_04680 [Planctomycetes bacterium]|nr:hypothetical protein [Planctomycetota bacterium]
MKTFLSIVLTLASVASLARAQNSNCIWIPDVGTGTVTLLGMDGTVRGVFAVGGAPRGAAVDAAGNAWISRLTERGVVRIAADGSRIDTFTAGITSKTCAIDRDGNVWITNQSLDLITKMTPAGIVLGDFPTGDGPRVVAIDRNNDVWLTCKFSGEVLKYDSLGNPYFRTQVGLGPRGIAIAEDGTAWVANLDSSTVSHLSAAGILLGDYPVPASPGGIAVDRRGNIWIASGLADVVTILRPDGTVLRSILTMPLGGHGALNVAPDGDGNMWVVCKLSSTVLKFNLDGRLERRTDLNTLSRPEPFGDLTGALRAKFANPSDDEDGDGLTNEIELGQGTNPFLAIDPSVREGLVRRPEPGTIRALRVSRRSGLHHDQRSAVRNRNQRDSNSAQRAEPQVGRPLQLPRIPPRSRNAANHHAHCAGDARVSDRHPQPHDCDDPGVHPRCRGAGGPWARDHERDHDRRTLRTG